MGLSGYTARHIPGSPLLIHPTRCIATALVASAVLLGPSCGGRQAPWDVATGDQARFEETVRVCRLLTDDDAGELAPERFEKCMKRRGWRRQGFVKRLFSGD
jgi:hypothetical protein